MTRIESMERMSLKIEVGLTGLLSTLVVSTKLSKLQGKKLTHAKKRGGTGVSCARFAQKMGVLRMKTEWSIGRVILKSVAEPEKCYHE